MNVLVIDTSGGAAVGLVRDDELVSQARHASPRQHAEQLGPLTHQVLAAAGLRLAEVDLLAVGTGPAPYTGLRAGLVTARLLAFAAGLPVVGMSPLDALAAQAFAAGATGQVLVVTDARRREVYWGAYTQAGRGVTQVEELGVGAPAAAPTAGRSVVGPAVGLLPTDEINIGPSVSELDLACFGRLARERWAAGTGGELVPAYLRRPDIHPGK
ncbi:tRNA (adenosine(37)-N6)-threonylcarbamoyltransferase complex dimerization subunit type 1 TsaB [Buchananella hordeovulneris]|uniref:tRNA (adenosine(37)-N6)-threonylcarbamoyltransferase complex dimerization subunit type 1 TsaB n=1 Tax=Buchananella hordeovulneris TaxID=52770 RepID=UPI001639A4C8|nr:tRNA (adenosine(37)-N6)-threonylcarbamoyltransferase complex dimerization subunit type 1 TsaB [Buchananella hordeovulneris]